MSNDNVQTLPPTLKFLNTTLQEINLLATQICQQTIRHAANNKQSFVHGVGVTDYKVPAEDFENLSIDLLDLTSKISSCQGVITKMIEETVSPQTEKTVTPTQVDNTTQVDTTKDPEDPMLRSFNGVSLDSVVVQYIGAHGILKRFNHGLDDYTTENSTLPKFKESVDDYAPDQIVNWPDGWYRANNTNHRELLITLDPFNEKDKFVPRILIKYNMAELVQDKMVQCYIADGAVWKREEQFSAGVLRMIKNKIVFKGHKLKNEFSLLKTEAV